jgi:hypothetical protein
MDESIREEKPPSGQIHKTKVPNDNTGGVRDTSGNLCRDMFCSGGIFPFWPLSRVRDITLLNRHVDLPEVIRADAD